MAVLAHRSRSAAASADPQLGDDQLDRVDQLDPDHSARLNERRVNKLPLTL
jgi:hypothetical protein